MDKVPLPQIPGSIEFAAGKFFEMTLDLLCVGDIETGHFLQLNPAWEKALGFSVEELMSRPWIDFVHPDDQDATIESGEKLLGGEDLIDFQNRYVCKDGSIKWLAWNTRVDTESKLVYAVARDITEHKKQDMVHNSLAAIVASSRDAIIGKDLNGFITSWNHAAEELYEYSSEEVIGEHITIIIPPDRKDDFSTLMNHVKTGQPVVDFETVRITKSGHRIDVSITLSTVENEDGEVVGISSIARDITQHKINTRKLKLHNEIMDSVGYIQSLYITDTDRKMLFHSLLEEIIELTSSKLGFIGEVIYPSEGAPQVKIHAISAGAWNDFTVTYRNKYESGCLDFSKPLTGQALTSNEVVIWNKENNNGYCLSTPEGHPEIESFMGVPLIQGDKKIGMFGVANRNGGYDQSLVDSIQPIIAAATNVIHAARIEENRKFTEKALRESEQKFKELTENLHQVVWLRTRYEILYVNPAFETIWGRSADTLYEDPDSFMDLIIPEDKQKLKEIIASDKYRETKYLDTQYRIKRDDGEIRWLWVRSFPIRNEMGEMYRTAGIFEDITSMKKSEESMRKMMREMSYLIEEIRNFKTISDRASYGAAIADMQGIITYCNQEFARMHGFRIKEVLGEHMSIFHNKKQMKYVEEHLTRVRENEAVTADKLWHSRKDGSVFPTLMNATMINDDDGSPMFIAATAVDITEMETAEYALKESEAQLSAILETAAEGIITIDEKGSIVSFNNAAEIIFGYSSEEVVGENISIFMTSPNAEDHNKYIERYIATGDAHIIGIGREVTGKRKSGELFPIDLAVSEVLLGDRRIFTGIIRDITERKEIDRMKNEFISVVSHELRTPLTSTIGSLGLLSAGVMGELPEEAMDLINVAKNNTERLVRLINDILDVEKIESGRIVLDIGDHDISEIVDRAMGEMSGFALDKNVELKATVEPHTVKADRDRITQVIVNLLSNAVKFSERGGVVEVVSKVAADRLELRVSDHGEGVPDHFRERIFQKFQQADSSVTRRKGGTGLGLSICKAIIEGHGQKITFEPTPGGGATFVFTMALGNKP